ncbi:general amidase [Panaeolus papilionaceus]|nr:general amidase [Panaeolus papilionaceus]
MSTQWQDLVAQKRRQQAASIPTAWVLPNPPSQDVLNVIGVPETCGLLSAKEIEITNSHVADILQRLASGSWTAVEVTTAFGKRAVIAHQLVNCLTEIFIDRALERARQLDKHLKETGKVVGPLHGLPISLKDQINIKGIESTMGYVSWIGREITQNSTLADILERAGAVLYVKTNIPQTLMWPETFNHIFGRTRNPHNRALTSGGSSGGEGALIALKGSPVGVGSDIGGSIRIPAMFNGLYGLRPSFGRVPYGGCVNSLEGQDTVLSVLGPISQSLDGIKSFMQVVAESKPWLKDPLSIRKPWNDSEYKLADHGEGKDKLCFAILWDDEVIKPHPPITRGLEQTRDALIAAGHKVIDWKPYKHDEIYKNVSAIWAAGAAEDYALATSPTQEPLIASMSLAVDDLKEYQAQMAALEGVSAFSLWQTHRARRILREEYLQHWNATTAITGTGRPVDAIISPGAPYTAPPHGYNKAANYTMIWNNLDYTALIIPTGLHVDPKVDVKQPSHTFYNTADKANYDLYIPEVFKDAPICVQLIGRTLEEEGVIAMGEIVDAAIKAWKDTKGVGKL